jgi:hypothetical protein
MPNWQVQLTCADKELGEVQIRRGIFQGDSLSPLLFVLCLIPMTEVLNTTDLGFKVDSAHTINHLLYMDDLKLYAKSAKEIEKLTRVVHDFSKDIGMEFGNDKCGLLNMRRGKASNSEGIDLDGEEIKDIETTGYKYLGILEYDNVLHKEMKEKIKKEYLTRVRLILKSHLNGGNTIQAINTWAVPVVRYSAGIVNWTELEKKQMDTKTRKLLTINRAMHPRSCVNRLYTKRKEGGRGLLEVQECINTEIKALSQYTRENNNPWMQLVWDKKILKDNEDPSTYKDRRRQERLTEWNQSALAGQYLRQTRAAKPELTWNWLRRGELKRETEGMLMAAQDQALKTNNRAARIMGENTSPKCRVCKEADETINHVVSECSMLAQREYKRRHDKVARTLHWCLSKKYGLPCADRWYQHEPQSVVENENVKILWDLLIQTDQPITARRPDLVVFYKREAKAKIVDVAIPYDSRIEEKQEEKITKYEDLRRELARMYRPTDFEVVPIVIGTLGATPRELEGNLRKIGCDTLHPGLLQKTVLLGTAHIIRKVLK